MRGEFPERDWKLNVLLSLLYESAITMKDLDDFSDDLKESMKRIYHRES